jgi:hypothetical protein
MDMGTSLFLGESALKAICLRQKFSVEWQGS